MEKQIRVKRCGECGRNFTKSQWRRNNFWCNICSKYICGHCIGRGHICPACGNKVNRKMSDGRFFTIMFSLTFFTPILLYTSLYVIYEGSGIDLVLFPLLVLIIILGFSTFFQYRIKIQRKKHLKYLDKMPEGIIPLKNRPSYRNQQAREIWSQEHRKHSIKSSSLMKGVFDGTEFLGIRGDWDFPILSKEERMMKAQQSQKNGIRSSVTLILSGILLLLFDLLIIHVDIIATLSVASLSLGLLILIIIIYVKKLLEKDASAEIKVAWNLVGFETTRKSIEDFLKSIRVGYHVETEDWPKKVLWHNPKYRYLLDNEIEIYSMYSESKDGIVFGYIAIKYNSKNYQIAKRIHRELDNYFIERDLIARAR